ncbi:hypothetical protein [Deinococcus sp.]|nr:hypothetical protein [Deinococcus sp.]
MTTRREMVQARRTAQEGDPGVWLLALILPLMILGGWLAQFI